MGGFENMSALRHILPVTVLTSQGKIFPNSSAGQTTNWSSGLRVMVWVAFKGAHQTILLPRIYFLASIFKIFCSLGVREGYINAILISILRF